MTRFTEAMWRETAAMRAAIDALPFNRDLAAGTLHPDRFAHYIVQDALYLIEYGRALALAAVTAPSPAQMDRFARATQGALTVERNLHASLFARFGVDPQTAATAEPSPTSLAYTTFLVATAATRPFGETVAALLPCFWVYWDVGRRIAATTAPDNPYQPWIDTYADQGFGEATQAVIEIADAAAARTSETERSAMGRAFHRSIRFEWMFWDSAYRREAWPNPVAQGPNPAPAHRLPEGGAQGRCATSYAAGTGPGVDVGRFQRTHCGTRRARP